MLFSIAGHYFPSETLNSRNAVTDSSNMKVQFLTAVVISFFLIILCTEATIVRKCQGKRVIKKLFSAYFFVAYIDVNLCVWININNFLNSHAREIKKKHMVYFTYFWTLQSLDNLIRLSLCWKCWKTWRRWKCVKNADWNERKGCISSTLNNEHSRIGDTFKTNDALI